MRVAAPVLLKACSSAPQKETAKLSQAHAFVVQQMSLIQLSPLTNREDFTSPMLCTFPLWGRTVTRNDIEEIQKSPLGGLQFLPAFSRKDTAVLTISQDSGKCEVNLSLDLSLDMAR